MTNWQISSPTIFICPDCEFEQREMTESCPKCGKRRLIKRSSRHHLYRFKFLMNRGMKKEKYLILLTTAQFERVSSLDEQDAYDQVQSKYWDHVIEMYDDKGCDYDSMIYTTECLDEDGKER